MAVNWKEILGWTDEQIRDLRFAGYSYLRQGKLSTAKTFFEALTIIDPASVYDMRTLGSIHFLAGDAKASLLCFDKALALAPTDELLRLNRGKSLLFLGQKKEGIALCRSLAASPHPDIANDAQALVLAYS